jgi:acetate kinase
MHILVINSGSSSIKFSLFEAGVKAVDSLYEGEVTGIGSGEAGFRFRDAQGKDLRGATAGEVKAGTPLEAIGLVVGAVTGSGLPEVGAVGYRVVHPGAKLDRHVKVTDEVLRDLEEAVVFAPLHDPAVIEVIREMMERFPGVGHFACFDTVFHESMKEEATTYALPAEVRAKGVRRYGFHGLSCESIVRQMLDAAECGEMRFPQRMVIAHLGSGCSVTAVVRGRSVDTTMGLTPTGGVVMGTRPGDLDPGVMLYLLRQETGDKAAALSAIEGIVNHAAGMVALSGKPNDMRAVREAAGKGDKQALLAVRVFTRSVRKAIGGFAWLMGGLDAMVFAGGIGEHDVASRAEILEGLEEMGVVLDRERDEANGGDGVRRVSAASSRVAVYVVPAEEDRMIAVHVLELVASN